MHFNIVFAIQIVNHRGIMHYSVVKKIILDPVVALST